MCILQLHVGRPAEHATSNVAVNMPARRSDERPDGLPDLEPSLKAGSKLANILYEVTGRAVKACVDAGPPCTHSPIV